MCPELGLMISRVEKKRLKYQRQGLDTQVPPEGKGMPWSSPSLKGSVRSLWNSRYRAIVCTLMPKAQPPHPHPHMIREATENHGLHCPHYTLYYWRLRGSTGWTPQHKCGQCFTSVAHMSQILLKSSGP
jgi:hypothetical protein